MHESHQTVSIGDSKNSVCVECGACSCHYGGCIEDLECSCIIANFPNRERHHAVDGGPISVSEKALDELRKKLYDKTDEKEAKFLFELRRTALNWVQINFSNVIAPQRKMELVEMTENFLRTGKFRTESVSESKAVSDLAMALVQTRDYVQPTVMLPAIEGWSWYDALKKHAPFVLSEVLQADARAHARKTAESDENEMENGDPTTND